MKFYKLKPMLINRLPCVFPKKKGKYFYKTWSLSQVLNIKGSDFHNWFQNGFNLNNEQGLLVTILNRIT